jgi:DNA-binding LacI/PurR family transcriptional regulator
LKVPDAIAVVGCDDTMVAGLLSPAFTILRVPKYGSAQARANRPPARAANT